MNQIFAGWKDFPVIRYLRKAKAGAKDLRAKIRIFIADYTLVRQFKLNASQILVVAPHPDDDIIGCGGLIGLKREKGVSVDVLYMTRGERVLRRYGFTSDLISRKRSECAVNALSRLGVNAENIIFLSNPCGQLKGSEPDQIAYLSQLIKDRQYGEVFCPHPRDGHPDHAATAKIVSSAINENKINVTLYYYFVWHWLNAEYRDMTILYKNGLALDISRIRDKKLSSSMCHLNEKSPVGIPWAGTLPSAIPWYASRDFELFMLAERGMNE